MILWLISYDMWCGGSDLSKHTLSAVNAAVGHLKLPDESSSMHVEVSNFWSEMVGNILSFIGNFRNSCSGDSWLLQRNIWPNLHCCLLHQIY